MTALHVKCCVQEVYTNNCNPYGHASNEDFFNQLQDLNLGSAFMKSGSLACIYVIPFLQSKAFVGNKGGVLGTGNAAFAGIGAGLAVAAIAVGILLTKDKGNPQGWLTH